MKLTMEVIRLVNHNMLTKNSDNKDAFGSVVIAPFPNNIVVFQITT